MGLERDGYLWVRRELSSDNVESLRSLFVSAHNQRLELKTLNGRVTSALSSITEHVSSILPNAKPVRMVTFNKSRNENWSLPWHQDRIISVCQRERVKGYSNWSRKAGLWHCEPPPNILKNMLTIRIHLDDADNQTGALEILTGSHKFGKIPAEKIMGVATQCEAITCKAEIGDILIMKMLMVHRSKPSISDAPRRAIRIDYSADTLPAPLQWEAHAN